MLRSDTDNSDEAAGLGKKKQSESQAKKAQSGAKFASSRDRESRNNNLTSGSFNHPLQSDPMGGFIQAHKTSAGLKDADHSRNQSFGAPDNDQFKSNKDTYVRNVKQQNQRLLQQQKMQLDQIDQFN